MSLSNPLRLRAILVRAKFWGPGIEYNCLSSFFQSWRHRCCPRPLHSKCYVVGVNFPKYALWFAVVTELNFVSFINTFFICQEYLSQIKASRSNIINISKKEVTNTPSFLKVVYRGCAYNTIWPIPPEKSSKIPYPDSKLPLPPIKKKEMKWR